MIILCPFASQQSCIHAPVYLEGLYSVNENWKEAVSSDWLAD